MSRRHRVPRRKNSPVSWLAALIIVVLIAAWQGFGHTGSASSEAGGSSNESASQHAAPSISDTSSAHAESTVAPAFKAPVSYAIALGYARQEVVAVPHVQGYSRNSQFGDWRQSGSLCGYGTTRDYVLKRDLTNVAMNQYCKVESGDFSNPYTGRSMHFLKGPQTSDEVQIDHIVAVQDAWASGLWQSSRVGERVSYYNDPQVLQASDASSNEAKGAGVDWDAATNPVWLPSNVAWRCDYMAKRAYIKHKYQLTMSQAEKTQTVNFLAQCAHG
ncbi:MAG: HNH endonuclease [Bifidobacterium aquikefiri]|uniref:HNH endonuclease n=1 Tax=Bifidobacterium aquikefiri TaxID=1653207 RepID=UPI001177807C|nr:HNH endonuclease [Bifidobacterium aquikefiri]